MSTPTPRPASEPAEGPASPVGPAQRRGVPDPAPGAPAEPAARRLAAWPLGRGLLLLACAVAVLAALLGAAVAALLQGYGVLGAALGAAGGALALGLPAALLLQRVASQAQALAAAPVLPDHRRTAASREFLYDLAEREFSRARRYGSGAALLLVEVDRWGRLSERRNAEGVQAVLQSLAADILPTLRGADVLAYQDTAQLAVFLVQADPTGALDVAERIRERAEQMAVPWQPEPLRFTVSVGVAHLRPAHQRVQSLFEDAADATQVAREVGGNCVRAAPVDRRMPAPPGQSQDDQRTRPGA
jgi:diguanylate cyclase (GGDEF)-like protein